MTPFRFEECNIILGKDQPEYSQLPAYKENSVDGELIYCFKLSFLERLQVLFTGKIWTGVLTYNKPFQPTFNSVFKDDLIPSKIGLIRRLYLFIDDMKEKIDDNRFRRSFGDDFPSHGLN